jgi:site-specific recombinase XerD
MCNTDIVNVSEKWISELEARRYSAATIYVRRDSLRQFTRFLQSRSIVGVREVTTGLLTDWRREMFERKLSVATVNQRLRTVRMMFDWLEEQAQVFENPASRLRMHRPPRPLPRVPTPEEVRRLLELPDTSSSMGVRDRALLEMLYCTGLRIGEAVRLRIGDLDLFGGSVKVRGKGGRERVLPLGTTCIEALQDYLDRGRPTLARPEEKHEELWLSRGGLPVRRQGLSVRIRHYMREINPDENWASHTLRRAAATHMLANGASPLALQEFLGHADMRHLRAYLRVTVNDLKDMHRNSRPGQ